MSINQSGWRPEAPQTGNADAPTFTGNRALMLEEPLIFEIGSTATTGVDFDEARVPAKAAYAGAQIRRSGTHGPHRLARPLRARDGAALYAAQRTEEHTSDLQSI